MELRSKKMFRQSAYLEIINKQNISEERKEEIRRQFLNNKEKARLLPFIFYYK